MRRFHSKENFHFTAMASAGAKISPRKKTCAALEASAKAITVFAFAQIPQIG